MKHDEYHRQFAEGIIEQIRQGTALWQKPWGPGERVLPSNVDTGRSYRGGNSLHLAAVASRSAVTATCAGAPTARSRPGTDRCARASRALASSRSRTTGRSPSTTSADGPRGTPKASASTATSASRRPSSASTPCSTPSRPTGCRPAPAAEPLWKVHQQAERVLEDSGVPVRHVAGDRAFYNLNRDEIVLPERGQFPSANHYYQTALHELGHSTGHPERMNRETLTQGISEGFGSPAYAKEELRAEISAMMDT